MSDDIAILQEVNADALALAQLASLAARVEPELLRALRLELLTSADVAAEADVWWSGLVESRSPIAIRLAREALPRLRQGLLGGGSRIGSNFEATHRVISRVHANAPEVVKIEECLIYWGLTGDLARAGDQLRSVLGALLDPARSHDHASWALAALPRLPDAVRQLEPFWAVLFAANAQGLGSCTVSASGWTEVAVRGALSVPTALLTRAGLVELEARLLGDQLGLRVSERTYSFDTPADGLLVPRLKQIFVEVVDGPFVELSEDRWTDIPIPAGKLELRAMDGRLYELLWERSSRDEVELPQAETEATEESESEGNEYLGARWLGDGRWQFRLWAPNASNVVLALLRPAVHHVMQRAPDGYWTLQVDGIQPGRQYMYDLVTGDQTLHRLDPAGRSIADSHGLPTAEVVAPLNMTPANSAVPRPEELLVYQLHVGSFTGRGDDSSRPGTFAALIPTLDYIKFLGFTAICLLPVHAQGYTVGWGFEPSHLFAVEPEYGKPLDLKLLVDAAHEKGLAVLLTVVYSHMGVEANTLWHLDGKDHDGGIYFEGAADTQWGHSFAWYKREVQEFFFQNARMWFEEYGVDGLYLDTLQGIDRSALKGVLGRLRHAFPDRLLVGEGEASALEPLGFDAALSLNAFSQIVQAQLSNNGLGHIQGLIGSSANAGHTLRIQVLMGLHFEIGHGRYLIDHYGGRACGLARAKCRLAWALNVTMPGIPWMLMGSECHMGLSEIAEKTWGRNGFGADGRFDWYVPETREGEQMLALVRAVNQLRWELPELRGNTAEVTHWDPVNQVLAFKRWNAEGNVSLTVVNLYFRTFAQRDYGVNTGNQPGRWIEVFCSQDEAFGGSPGAGNRALSEPLLTQADGRVYINVPKVSVVCLRLVVDDPSSLQGLIAAAPDGGTVRIPAGLYRERLVIDKAVDLVGDGEVIIEAPTAPVIELRGDGASIKSLTVRHTGDDDGAVVELSRGPAVVHDCRIEGRGGRGVRVHPETDASIVRTKISKCRMEGLELLADATAQIHQNEIFQNQWGVSIKEHANPRLTNNRIHHNEHVGVFVEGGFGQLHENEIFSNGREGVLIKDFGSPYMDRNTIRENIKAGVYVEAGGQGLIEDNDIRDNRESGVAIGDGGAPTVRNNRIHGNNGKGVWCADHAKGTVEENDLQGNAFGARHPMDGEHHPSQTVFKDNRG